MQAAKRHSAGRRCSQTFRTSDDAAPSARCPIRFCPTSERCLRVFEFPQPRECTVYHICRCRGLCQGGGRTIRRKIGAFDAPPRMCDTELQPSFRPALPRQLASGRAPKTSPKARMFATLLRATAIRRTQDKEAIMATGTVKFFNVQKGFGFIAPSDGSRDVFVHISAVERAGITMLTEGQKVSYD